MNIETMRERTERLRNIPLESVLRALGAKQDRYDKKKWHTSQGVISVNGMKFINWNRTAGGGGAIDLIIHLQDIHFKEAVAWLCGHFQNHDTAHLAHKAPKKPLTIPQPAPSNLYAVKQYLHTKRRIPVTLIDRLIQSGDLYADNHLNAVFLMRGKHRILIGAELRGTGHSSWRGMALGSNKNLGGFSIRGSTVDGIILCESAIDAISCFHFHPSHCCLSTAGARANPLWLPSLIQKGKPIYCGYDTDTTGDDIARSMITQYPSLSRLRPQEHDWNEMLIASTMS